MPSSRIVAVGLLTRGDLQALGKCFTRAYPIDQVPCFGALLSAIDDAERELRREGGEAPDKG